MFEHHFPKSAPPSSPSLWGCLKGLGITLVAGVLCLLTLSGCGREAFLAAAATEKQAAPGSFTIPP